MTALLSPEPFAVAIGKKALEASLLQLLQDQTNFVRKALLLFDWVCGKDSSRMNFPRANDNFAEHFSWHVTWNEPQKTLASLQSVSQNHSPWHHIWNKFVSFKAATVRLGSYGPGIHFGVPLCPCSFQQEYCFNQYTTSKCFRVCYTSKNNPETFRWDFFEAQKCKFDMVSVASTIEDFRASDFHCPTYRLMQLCAPVSPRERPVRSSERF